MSRAYLNDEDKERVGPVLRTDFLSNVFRNLINGAPAL